MPALSPNCGWAGQSETAPRKTPTRLWPRPEHAAGAIARPLVGTPRRKRGSGDGDGQQTLQQGRPRSSALVNAQLTQRSARRRGRKGKASGQGISQTKRGPRQRGMRPPQELRKRSKRNGQSRGTSIQWLPVHCRSSAPKGPQGQVGDGCTMQNRSSRHLGGASPREGQKAKRRASDDGVTHRRTVADRQTHVCVHRAKAQVILTLICSGTLMLPMA